MKRRIVSLLLALYLFGLFVGTACAASEPQLSYVTDEAGLLQEAQLQQLEQMAQSVADRYSVGVYIVTVPDYRELDPAGVYEATYGVYHEYSLGEGQKRNGILLLLSMSGRDYALFRYGEQAVYAFNDYGVEKLEETFLDNFGKDDWNGGFADFLLECDRYLEKAASGKPVRESPVTRILIAWAIALVIAAVVCAVLKGQMKTVHKGTSAASYGENLGLTEQLDQFTHRTETRRKIESTKSSGESHSGGSSGKF